MHSRKVQPEMERRLKPLVTKQGKSWTRNGAKAVTFGPRTGETSGKKWRTRNGAKLFGPKTEEKVPRSTIAYTHRRRNWPKVKAFGHQTGKI